MKTSFLRQIDILDPKVCNKTVYIIGAGATGSFVALSLAKMGLNDIRVFDSDTIEEHNFPNQLFPLKYLGCKKTDSLESIVKDFTGVKITNNPTNYITQPLKDIVISALDTMKGRKQIYKNSLKKGDVKLLIDPRTGPELFRILTINTKLETERKFYETTLYSDREADEAPCTGRSIIYGVLAVSAYVCRQVKRYLMNEEYNRDITVDMRYDLLFK